MDVGKGFIRSLYSGMSTGSRADITLRLHAMDVEDQTWIGTPYDIGGPEDVLFMILNESARQGRFSERCASGVASVGTNFALRADVGAMLIEKMYRSMTRSMRAEVKQIVREVDRQQPGHDSPLSEIRPRVVDLP